MEDTLGVVMLLVGVGLLFSLLVFFICEEKSVKDSDFSDMQCMTSKEDGLSQCLEQFNTIKYITTYFVILLMFNIVATNFVVLPNDFGLEELFAYTFVTSFLGSAIILFVKWTNQPMMKLISSFLYGSTFMAASVIVFSITFIFKS